MPKNKSHLAHDNPIQLIRTQKLNTQTRVFIPRLLGYLGLIPFIVSSALIWIPLYHHTALESLSIYAAVILTFVGGVHWGIAVLRTQQTSSLRVSSQFIFSVVPSLIAWITIVFINPYALIILAISFVLFWLIEKLHYQQPLPAWYSQLRNHLTLVATFSIIVGWLGTL
jgi:hypothetical protein